MSVPINTIERARAYIGARVNELKEELRDVAFTLKRMALPAATCVTFAVLVIALNLVVTGRISENLLSYYKWSSDTRDSSNVRDAAQRGLVDQYRLVARISASGSVNVRSAPSVNSRSLGALSPGTYVEICQRGRNWDRVAYGSQTAWIYNNLLGPVEVDRAGRRSRVCEGN